MESNFKTVMMKPVDKVAVALMPIPAGTELVVNCQENIFHIILKDDIQFGHKFAVVPIAQGDAILKYGEVIGRAITAIQTGEHVHVHNLEGTRGRGDKVG